jgi:hypothetical protein
LHVAEEAVEISLVCCNRWTRCTRILRLSCFQPLLLLSISRQEINTRAGYPFVEGEHRRADQREAAKLIGHVDIQWDGVIRQEDLPVTPHDLDAHRGSTQLQTFRAGIRLGKTCHVDDDLRSTGALAF